jgi:hypothetical protein
VREGSLVRVHLVLDVDARERYVISRYFGDRKRRRATRRQVREFAVAALRSSVNEHAEAFPRIQRAAVKRLADPEAPPRPELRPPAEKQMGLFTGAQ